MIDSQEPRCSPACSTSRSSQKLAKRGIGLADVLVRQLTVQQKGSAADAGHERAALGIGGASDRQRRAAHAGDRQRCRPTARRHARCQRRPAARAARNATSRRTCARSRKSWPTRAEARSRDRHPGRVHARRRPRTRPAGAGARSATPTAASQQQPVRHQGRRRAGRAGRPTVTTTEYVDGEPQQGGRRSSAPTTPTPRRSRTTRSMLSRTRATRRCWRTAATRTPALRARPAARRLRDRPGVRRQARRASSSIRWRDGCRKDNKIKFWRNVPSTT